MIKAVGRQAYVTMLHTQNLRDTLVVDTFDGAPINMEKFRPLNPFYTWNEPVLYVPGLDKKSRSVEAIWQGCKLIDGKLDHAQFLTLPYKRPPEKKRLEDASFDYPSTQFMYGNRLINQLQARYLIYLSAYLNLINDLIPESLIFQIKKLINANKTILFVDWDENVDIDNIHASFSHSAILAAWFEKQLEKYLDQARCGLSQTDYLIFLTYFNQYTTKYNKYVGGAYDS